MLKDVARIQRALADETRLRAVCLLQRLGELCVCDMEAALGVTQSRASRHLNTLRQAGLVLDRRDGAWVYYRLAPDGAGAARVLLDAALQAALHEPIVEQDVSRALALRRSPRCDQPPPPDGADGGDG